MRTGRQHNRRKAIPLGIALFLSAATPFRATLSAEGISFSLEAAGPWGETPALEAKASARGDLGEGSVSIERDAAGEYELRTASLKLVPIGGLALFLGALRARGLPGRALNPAFPLAGPFREAEGIAPGPTLARGAGKAVKNAGIEARFSGWDLSLAASWADRRRGWISLVRTSEAGDGARRPSARVGLLAGWTDRAPGISPADPWFAGRPALPEGRILVGGIEADAAWGPARENTTLLASFSTFRVPLFSFRTEWTVEWKAWGVSAGFFAADSGFESLTGTTVDLSGRWYVSVSTVQHHAVLGAALSGDRRVGEDFGDPERERLRATVGGSLQGIPRWKANAAFRAEWEDRRARPRAKISAFVSRRFRRASVELSARSETDETAPTESDLGVGIRSSFPRLEWALLAGIRHRPNAERTLEPRCGVRARLSLGRGRPCLALAIDSPRSTAHPRLPLLSATVSLSLP